MLPSSGLMFDDSSAILVVLRCTWVIFQSKDKILIQEDAFENVVCEMASILSMQD